MKYGLPENTLLALTQVLKSYPEIQDVILYGSRAKGTYHEGSDIDLCLDAPNLTLETQFKIENQIDDLLLPWKVDLSVKHRIQSADLLSHIHRIGIKIYPINLAFPSL